METTTMSEISAEPANLFAEEYIDVAPTLGAAIADLPDSDINSKYVKGEVRIVTEQARYPINSIANIVEDADYTISPEYQRRHRWDQVRKSRLIESLIMNVPVPPIFLYEFDYSKYEVMDGLQRLTAIHEFYRNKYALTGLVEWPELNGRTYEALPSKVREGIDRRYLSSVILLKETAHSEEDALRLKQLVFERINSGGVRLSPQESRNALFDGPMNQLCIRLSKLPALCRLWGIPEPEQGELDGGLPSEERIKHNDFREMTDVELVLRFFAYRQKHRLHRSGEPLGSYFDRYLRRGNSFPQDTLDGIGDLFARTIEFSEELFGYRCFFLFRKRSRSGTDRWSWRESSTTTVYDPLMLVLSQMLPQREVLLEKTGKIRSDIKALYKTDYDTFEGRNVNPTALQKREEHYRGFLRQYL